ncbi:hypothetical protein M0R45_026445 [Rubus argutus]|uniref:Ubiquitin-like protease family profile domain-containing protein n=1 Tax=Rubus argutus TaxID=59490 RepID=A0AAW1WZA9_RUBAR
MHIFIPLNDDKCAHWFLLVMDLNEQQAEVWDNRPDSGSEEHHLEYTSAAVLQIIFANEMTKTRDVYFHFPSFTITVPESNPTMNNNLDSDIFVIRHMQYYNREWFREFNSEDQWIRLALEITNHPRNEMSEFVLVAAAAHNQVDHYVNIACNKMGQGINNAGKILSQS